LCLAAEDIAKKYHSFSYQFKARSILDVQYWTLRRQSVLIPTRREDRLKPDSTADGKLRLHSEKTKAMHVPVKGWMGLFGIDLGGLIKVGKVPGVQAQEDAKGLAFATRMGVHMTQEKESRLE